MLSIKNIACEWCLMKKICRYTEWKMFDGTRLLDGQKQRHIRNLWSKNGNERKRNMRGSVSPTDLWFSKLWHKQYEAKLVYSVLEEVNPKHALLILNMNGIIFVSYNQPFKQHCVKFCLRFISDVSFIGISDLAISCVKTATNTSC